MGRGDGQSPGGYAEGTARPPLGRGQALRGRAGVPPVWVPVTRPTQGSFLPSSPRALRTQNPDTIRGPGGHLTPSAPSTEDSTARTEGPLLLSPELTWRSGPSNLVEVTEARDGEAPSWGSSVGGCLQTPRFTQPPELGWTVMSCTLEFQRKLLGKRVSAPHFTGTSLTLCGFRGNAGPGGEGGSATRS